MGDQPDDGAPGDRVNVEEALRAGDNEPSLLQVWDLVSERGMWQYAVEDAWQRGDAESVGVAQAVLDGLPEVTALRRCRPTRDWSTC